jgi:serine phosphatase RsbU (regulator of sigma subunit)
VPGRINRINESLIRQGKLDLKDIRSWRETFFQEMQAFDMLSSVTWGDEDGRGLWVCRYADAPGLIFAIKDKQAGTQMHEYPIDEGGKIPDHSSGRFVFDPRLRPWYIAAKEAGKPTWSEPYVWVGKEDAKSTTLGISFGQPYQDQSGRITSVIDCDLSLQDISRFLESLPVGKTGQAFVMDRRGRLVANSTGSSVVGSDKKQLLASASPDPDVAGAVAHVNDSVGSIEHITEPYQDKVLIDGQTCLLMVSPFEHETGLSWKIATLVPESDFLAGVWAGRRRSVVIGLLALLLTVGLGMVLSRKMVRPILDLAAHVRQIGKGDLDTKLQLPYSPEFSRLSDEINAMAEGLRDRMRLRHSLALAMDVQQNLLPSDTPTVEGLDIAGHSTYCDETGGDYYDFLDVTGLSDSTAAIAVGDVVGHGIAAALLMASARGILRSRCAETGSLGDLLGHMNEHLAKDIEVGRFMTMLLMTLDSKRGEMRWASAGHDPPIVYDAGSDNFLELSGGSFPLGVMEDTTYDEYTVADVRAGQIYLGGTDGIWETADSGGEMFGKERLCELIRRNTHLSAAEISEEVRGAVERFRGDGKQDDDITFVIVKTL